MTKIVETTSLHAYRAPARIQSFNKTETHLKLNQMANEKFWQKSSSWSNPP